MQYRFDETRPKPTVFHYLFSSRRETELALHLLREYGVTAAAMSLLLHGNQIAPKPAGALGWLGPYAIVSKRVYRASAGGLRFDRCVTNLLVRTLQESADTEALLSVELTEIDQRRIERFLPAENLTGRAVAPALRLAVA